MPFVRVNCGVVGKGNLVDPIAVEKFIRGQKDKAQKDWYVSPYIYDDEVMQYWEANGRSIAGYTGKAWTDHVYWDIDRKGDLASARNETIKLVKYLVKNGYEDGIEVYFSGQKGFHVVLRTEQTFEREQLTKVASGVIKASGVEVGFDTSVYNITRILRYPHTKHQESGLFKIPLEWDQLTSEIEEILDLAETSHYQKGKPKAPNVDASELVSKMTAEDLSIVQPHETDASDLLSALYPLTRDANDQKRRCIEVLESGDFGPGERDNALIRLAAYYRGTGVPEEEAWELMNDALDKRAILYPDSDLAKESETLIKLKQAYGPTWKGGMYTCKTDEFLQSKCTINGKACYHDKVKHAVLGKEVVGIGSLIRSYVAYGEEAHLDYPKFGIPKLDEKVRIRPKNFSVIAGASGTGKTSIIIQMLDKLNEQKIPHLFLSLDMSDNSLVEKLAARHTPYTIKQIEQAFSKHTRNEEMVVEIAQQLMKKLPYTYFDFLSSMSMKHLENTVLKLNQDLGENPAKVVFVDYAGRMMGGGDNAYANATANALQANDVAKATDTHLMFISQVSREAGDHTTPLRSSRVAKESGSWEENATFVITCWRPFGDGVIGTDQYFAMYLGKNRAGGLGEMHFHWEGKTGTIREMTSPEYNEYVELCKQFEKDPPPAGDHPEGFEAAVLPKESSSSRVRSRKERQNQTKNEVVNEARSNAYDSNGSDHEEDIPSDYQPPRREKTYRSNPRGP